jgi:hypothetical protein
MRENVDAGFWLKTVNDWGDNLSWSIVEPDKRARAGTALGSYSIEVQSDNKSYRLRFTSEANERVCPTRFTAINRICWEAEDHFRRLRAQQQQPIRLKASRW